MSRPAAHCGRSRCSKNIRGRSARPRPTELCRDDATGADRMNRRQAALVAGSAYALVWASVAHADTDAATVETGERIYADYCSSCHGEELRNTSGGVTFDLRRLKPGDHERFVSVVLNGKNQMPPWRGALEPDQIEAICRYMRVTLDK